MKRYNRKKNIRWNTMKILAAGFLFVIVAGAVLLWLPVSNQKPIEFFDALFTSASAVCVTGLVTIIPQTQFTLFGKVILLILIQIGGLGIIACVTAFFLLLRRQITVRERMVIQETYNADSIGGIVGMVRRILIGTFTVEGVGALFYAVQFVPEYGLLRELGIASFIRYLRSVMQELIYWVQTVWQNISVIHLLILRQCFDHLKWYRIWCLV